MWKKKEKRKKGINNGISLKKINIWPKLPYNCLIETIILINVATMLLGAKGYREYHDTYILKVVSKY